MSDPQAVADLFAAACLGIFVYAIGSLLALVITSDWFLNTWLGRTIEEAWTHISANINKILPPYKR